MTSYHNLTINENNVSIGSKNNISPRAIQISLTSAARRYHKPGIVNQNPNKNQSNTIDSHHLIDCQ